MSQFHFPILMYHSVQKMPRGTKMRSLHISPKRFKFQMRLLKLFGYRGVSVHELYLHLKNENKEKVVGISFDDGYKNNFSIVMPILKKLEFTATIYLVSQNIGKTNLWDSKLGLPEQKLMNDKEIQKWIQNGMEIGSHTRNHLSLSNCDHEIALKEISQSKLDLERKFKTQIRHFCYPYGNFNNETIEIVKKSGYLTATTTQRGRSKRNDNFFTLPRVQVTHHTLPHLFLLKVLSSYEDNRKK
jgi:peptidoglycan/xylan/chitin deacetylase (PgdA/CDA1 family)